MAWIVGIDEAGYGPNLGPLVQAAVALSLPDSDPSGWDCLRPWVRRAAEPVDHRLCLDDSKKIYHGAQGFRRLEEGVFAALGWSAGPLDERLASLLDADLREELSKEHWYQSTERLPLHSNLICEPRWPDWWQPGPVAVNLVTTPRFNQMVNRARSKATVLAAGLIHLLQIMQQAIPRQSPEAGKSEPVLVFCDKQGGRNQYAPMLQAAFPEGWVITERESAAESRYRITGLDRDWCIVITPRADASGVAVAVASMLAKYLREVCMLQMNRFWRQHLPQIQPTAGYPVDARRFLAEIRPLLVTLNLAEEAIWRVK